MSLEKEILSKIGKKDEDILDVLTKAYEVFCADYGFISFDEFVKIPWLVFLHMLKNRKERFDEIDRKRFSKL